MAYASIEPFGDFADDYRAGLIAAMYCNLKRAPGTEAVMPLDLFPWRQRVIEPPREETREELEARIRRDLLGDHG